MYFGYILHSQKYINFEVLKNNMVSQKEIDKVYKKYKSKTNMTFRELVIWSKNPMSNKASLNREPIKRNLRLLFKPKENWTALDVRDANKTIAFISRMKKVKSGKTIGTSKLSKRDISLLNWGFNPYK